jgi:hypothetical protein
MHGLVESLGYVVARGAAVLALVVHIEMRPVLRSRRMTAASRRTARSVRFRRRTEEHLLGKLTQPCKFPPVSG